MKSFKLFGSSHALRLFGKIPYVAECKTLQTITKFHTWMNNLEEISESHK